MSGRSPRQGGPLARALPKMAVPCDCPGRLCLWGRGKGWPNKPPTAVPVSRPSLVPGPRPPHRSPCGARLTARPLRLTAWGSQGVTAPGQGALAALCGVSPGFCHRLPHTPSRPRPTGAERGRLGKPRGRPGTSCPHRRSAAAGPGPSALVGVPRRPGARSLGAPGRLGRTHGSWAQGVIQAQPPVLQGLPWLPLTTGEGGATSPLGTPREADLRNSSGSRLPVTSA